MFTPITRVYEKFVSTERLSEEQKDCRKKTVSVYMTTWMSVFQDLLCKFNLLGTLSKEICAEWQTIKRIPCYPTTTAEYATVI